MVVPRHREDVAGGVAGGVDVEGASFDDEGRGDHEAGAELFAGVAGDGVGDLADEFGAEAVVGFGFADEGEEGAEFFARRGVVDVAAVRAGDADDGGKIEGDGFVFSAEVRGAEHGFAAGVGDGGEVAGDALGEDFEDGFFHGAGGGWGFLENGPPGPF